MKSSAKITARVSLDRVRLSCFSEDGYVPLARNLGEYSRVGKPKPIDKSQARNPARKKHEVCENFKVIFNYFHDVSGNKLRICTGRRRSASYAPSLILIFDSSYSQTLLYKDVESALSSFQKFEGISFRVTEVHVAVDLSAPIGTGLYEMISKSIRAGKKGKPSDKYKYETSRIFGSPRSATQLSLYDKARDQWDKYGIDLKEDVVRIESRLLKIGHFKGFPRSLKEIGKMNWAFLHPAFFSFHRPTRKLKHLLNKQELNFPIWELRDLVMERFGITSSNFYRDYVRDEKRFSIPVVKALARYQWNPMVKKQKP